MRPGADRADGPLVVIAGAGPTGIMLACELGLMGVPCAILDRRAAPGDERPGLAINATVVDLLTQRGLMDSLRPYGDEFRRAHFSQLWLDPTRLPERHSYSFTVAESRLHQCLADRARVLGIDVRLGHEVVGLDQDEAEVRVRVRAEGGAEETLRCSYLVGCDGRGSTVRNLAGIAFPGSDFAFHGIVGDLELDSAGGLAAAVGATEHAGGLLMVRPLGQNTLRVMCAEFDRVPADPAAPVTVAELRASLSRLCGADTAGLRSRWLARWDAPTRLADRYRADRVFVAGDAAHVHFPFGGQALSTGIEDAVNLGWKLAGVADGRGGEALLDSYQAERRPVGERACLSTSAQTALLHPLARVAPLREVLKDLIAIDDVNDYFVRMAFGLDVVYPMNDQDVPGHPLLGRRLADVPLKTAQAETSVAVLLRSGRGLMLDLRGTDGAAPETWGWPHQVDVIRCEPTGEIDAAVVLVRPDGRVAWAASAVDGTVTDPADQEDRSGSPAGHPALHAALTRWFGLPRNTAATAS
jgi:2-polyprenyl-6-methoxyphenol hydroxylase-like FAD-dependent oxidoreductase